MPPRSKVEMLPEEVRDLLNARLIATSFSNYEGLSDWLLDQGFEIKKSALHNYGSAFEERIAQLRVATEQAKAIVAESPDDEGAMSEALMRLVQERLFTILKDLQVDPTKVSLSGMAKAVAELGRASVTQKKYAAEVRERAAAVADQASKIAKRGGLSTEAANEIRSAILGIAK